MGAKLSIFALLAGLALAAGALPGGPVAPDEAEATHGRQCGVVGKGNRDYLVLAKKVGCRKGRKGAKRFLKKGKALRGFKCSKNVGAYEFVCKKRSGRRGALSYRAQRL